MDERSIERILDGKIKILFAYLSRLLLRFSCYFVLVELTKSFVFVSYIIKG